MARSKWNEPLVSIDQVRLRAAFEAAALGTTELARRSGVSRQRIEHLLEGTTRRCRQSDRAALARALRTTVAFLEGAPNAAPPGVAATWLALRERYPDLRLNRGAGARPVIEGMRLYDLVREVLGSPPTDILDEEFSRGAADVALWRLLHVANWRQKLRPTLTFREASEEDVEEFAVHMARALTILLRGFDAEQDPMSPAAARALMNALLLHDEVSSSAGGAARTVELLERIRGDWKALLEHRVSDPDDAPF